MKRLKVLISAYACEPGKGSEPGVGWNVVREMARHHDVCVLTRENNRSAIEDELAGTLVPGLRFAYYDLPRWARWWKKGGRGVQLYYYLWQLGAYIVARRLHQEIGFNLVHHVTFVKYWAPSFVSLLPVPFVWGPVGGGESAPKAFCQDFSAQGKQYERLRDWARWLGEHDPVVRLTARRSRVALATTEDTAERLRVMGVREVHTLSQVGFRRQELTGMDRLSASGGPIARFVSVGNLLHWKGFHLGLRAFAEAGLQDAEYWVIGDGPERLSLESLARSLGIADCITFWGQLSRQDALRKLVKCSALVHPSLHDSGGFVCLEAMAAGKPVICLDLGGPAVQVTPETGIKIAARHPAQVVSDMADAMRRLAEDDGLRQRMGEAGRQRVHEEFSWTRQGDRLNAHYVAATGPIERLSSPRA